MYGKKNANIFLCFIRKRKINTVKIELRLFKLHTLKHNKYAIKTVDSKIITALLFTKRGISKKI